jgi:predicted Zn-dependent protease with MMP-like domain
VVLAHQRRHLAEALGRAAFDGLPDSFRRLSGDVIIAVAEFPEEDVLTELGAESEFDLLGLYRGVSLNNKSVTVSSQDVDMVFLYRRPILDYWCETGEDLTHLVRHVLIHEIGHHFGFSDEDMEAIEDQA